MPEPKTTTLGTGVQLLAVAGLCGVCFYAGGKLNSVTPNGKYVVADKNAVILSAVLDRNSTDVNALRADIAQPVMQVMRRYADEGYVVIDGARDERGNLTIAALPADTRDITKELTAAINRKETAK